MEFNFLQEFSDETNLSGFQFQYGYDQVWGASDSSNSNVSNYVEKVKDDETKSVAETAIVESPCTKIAVLNKGVCSVCGDHSIGIHYGAPVCSGCRGFFRRTAVRGKKYKCLVNNGKCEISKFGRRNCKACRFRTCLRAGMKMEEPRTKRNRIDECNNDEPDPMMMMVDDSTILNSTQTINIMYLLETYYASKDYALSMIAIPNVDEYTLENEWKKFVHAGHNAYQAQAVMIGSWIKRIPGFKDLDLGDQVLLFRSAVQKYFTIRTAYDTATAPEDLDKNRLNCLGKVKTPMNFPRLMSFVEEKGLPRMKQEQQANIFFNDLIIPVRNAGISEDELACFAAFLLLDPNIKGLSNPGAVRKLRKELQSLIMVEKELNSSLTSGVMDLYSLLPTINSLTLALCRHMKTAGWMEEVDNCSRLLKDIFYATS